MANIKSPELFTRHLRHRHIKAVKMFPGPQILLGNSGEPHGTFLSMIFLKLFQEKIQRKLGSQASFLIRIVSHTATIYSNPYRSPTYLLQNEKIII